MSEWAGVVFAAGIAASLVAAIASMMKQARRGERADAKMPWRWVLLACVIGLLLTIAAAINSDWSVRSIGAVVPFAVLGPLAFAGATGRLHRDRSTDGP